MAILSISLSHSGMAVPVHRLPRASAGTAASRKAKQGGEPPPPSGRFDHFGEVVRKDMEFLKKKIGGGIRWANKAFRIPQMTKAVEDVVWLRCLEDPHSPPPEPLAWPVTSYTGLSGVDLFMADLKALEAYAGYFYSQSKVWSKPLPEVYDPEAVANYFGCRPHVVAFRLLEVFFAFMFAFIRIRTSKSDKGNKNVEDSGQNFGMVLKETMLNLGPTFIKLGQSLSTRPDIIGTEISEALSELHEQIPPFPRPQAMTIVEEELGSPIESFFSYISQETIAAASFGQVYRGRTLDGSDVAVKVQRPDLQHVVLRDIYILRLGMGLLRKIAKRESDIRLYADELGKGLVGELDYTLEAANSSEFLEVHSRFPFIRVPKVYQHLTRKRVLTMEWVFGESPTDLFSVSSGNSDHDFQYPEKQKLEARRRLLDLVNKGVEATLVQLLETGLLHADPHPGNLRYTTSGQIGFLDFGLVCRMQRKHQLAMLASIVHIVNGDWASLVQALTVMDVIKPGINTRCVTMDLEVSLGDLQLKDGIPDIKFSKVLGKILSVAVNYQFRMPPYFTLILRSLASFEGLALAADPSFKTFEAAYPFVAQKLLTENSAEMRTILHSVVFTRKKEFRWERLALFLRIGVSSRKIVQRLALLSDGASVDSVPRKINRDFDTTSLILKLLASKDGVVLRRLLMTANGNSLIQTAVSKEAQIFRQQLCRIVADLLYQWMAGTRGIKSPKFGSQLEPSAGLSTRAYDYRDLVRDRRLRVIIRKMLESVRRDPVLVLKLGWTSFVMFVTATALACHRFVISVSQAYMDRLFLANKPVPVHN